MSTQSLSGFATTLTPERIELIDKLFKTFDTDGSGYLGAKALQELLSEMHAHVELKTVQSLLDQLDSDGDGRVSQEEFMGGIQWVQQAVKLSRSSKRCQQAHGAGHDHAPSGEETSTSERPQEPSAAGSSDPKKKIVRVHSVRKRIVRSSRSIADFALELGPEEVQRVREIFELCDENGDGQVDPDELRNIMREMSVDVAPDDFSTLWERLDTRKRGSLSFEDFLRGIKTLRSSLNMVTAPIDADQEEEEEEAPELTLEQKNDILLRYVRDVVKDALAIADRSCDERNPRTASRLLRLIDYDVVKELEPLVGPGRLTSQETDAAHAAVAAKIRKTATQQRS